MSRLTIRCLLVSFQYPHTSTAANQECRTSWRRWIPETILISIDFCSEPMIQGWQNDSSNTRTLDQLLNCACFMYIGAWLPFDQFNNPDLGITPWRLVVLFITILFLRRIPSLLLLYKWVREVDGWREALFSGHFGEQLSPDHSEYTKKLTSTCLC